MNNIDVVLFCRTSPVLSFSRRQLQISKLKIVSNLYFSSYAHNSSLSIMPHTRSRIQTHAHICKLAHMHSNDRGTGQCHGNKCPLSCSQSLMNPFSFVSILCPITTRFLSPPFCSLHKLKECAQIILFIYLLHKVPAH